jgi:thioredoxin-related protein
MKIFAFLLISFLPVTLHGQEEVNLYNPLANARADIAQAVQMAKAQNKQVLIQVGGNWCPWCIRLHHFFESDAKVDSILKADYVFTLVNYSKENKNPDILASLGYPQRFGFPVLVVLDQHGNRLHTQDTGYLEKDKGYDEQKVITFLLNWDVKALDPETYEK